MKTISITELRQRAGVLLNDVEFKKETIVLRRHSRDCAKIVPIDYDVVVSDPAASLSPAVPPAPEIIPGETRRKPGKRR
jgi:antitoxin (DNA-binding transcriptional repressor) of toxin-antitoxin stability system